MISLGLSPPQISQSKEDVIISFSLDDTFTGIMQGAPDDGGEGCTLSGKCVLRVQRPIKVNRIILFFEGRCKVHLKETNSYGMASISGTSETRSLYNCQQVSLGQVGKIYALQPGIHTYQFSFDLPSHLPASFQGARGYIRYRLNCEIYRPMFTTDLRSSMDIPIKRCLVTSDPMSLENCVATTYGTKHTNKIQYSGTAPTMVYREGGQIRLNLAMQLLQPYHYSIKSVTWALKEKVEYRTTNSQSRTMVMQSDDRYPIGFNTFYPDQTPNYDPIKHQSYNVSLRLIPRVNATIDSEFIKVTHSLEINILLQQLGDGDAHATDENNGTTTNWQSTDTPDQCTLWTQDQSNNSGQEHQQQTLGTLSTSTIKSTSPSLYQSLPSTSKSIFSLKNKCHYDSNSLERKASRTQEKQQYRPNSIAICTLEIPIVVTSRHSIHERQMSTLPPSYRQSATGAPPDYLQTMETCAPVPNYENNGDLLDEQRR